MEKEDNDEDDVEAHNEAIDDDEEDEEDDEAEPQLRRSNRVSTKPSYLDDYILLAEIECERLLITINNEPWDFNEAKEMKVWTDACKEEIFSMEKNNTWVLVELSKGFKPIGLKWVLRSKETLMEALTSTRHG